MVVKIRGSKTGLNSIVNCSANGANCTISCQSRNGCQNMTVITSNMSTVTVICDESQGILCPNGYLGPTEMPTMLPTVLPTEIPSLIPSFQTSKDLSSVPSVMPSKLP